MIPLATSHHGVSFHLNEAAGNIFERKGELGKEEKFQKRFITKTKRSLSGAMDSLNSFAEQIGRAELSYQMLLDHPELSLDEKVHLEGLAKRHIYNLKSLYQSQKITLTQITQLFLEISRDQLKRQRINTRDS